MEDILSGCIWCCGVGIDPGRRGDGILARISLPHIDTGVVTLFGVGLGFVSHEGGC